MKSNIVSTSPSLRMAENLSSSTLVSAGLVPLNTTARSLYIPNRFIEVTDTLHDFTGAGYLSSTIGTIPVGATARTTECMAYFTTNPASNNGSIIHWGTGNTGQDWCLVPRGGEISSNIGGHFWTLNLNSGTNITTEGMGTWIHMCMTYNGTVAKIYVNGVLKASGTLALNTGSSALNISRRSTTNEYTSGRFRELRIWNKELSAEQVADVVNTRLEYIPSGLIFYTRMNFDPVLTDRAGGHTIASNGTVGTTSMTYTVFSRKSSLVL